MTRLDVSTEITMMMWKMRYKNNKLYSSVWDMDVLHRSPQFASNN
jgi:hypothetical protein